MPQNKFARPKREIEMPRKNLLKLICGLEKQCYKNSSFIFCFPGSQMIKMTKEPRKNPERTFSDSFNTFVNQWCIKNDGNVFILAFRLLLFPKFQKCWKHTHIKNKILTLARN